MTLHHRPTVADLLALKGKQPLSMLRVLTLDEAAAAQQAGIHILSVPPSLLGPAFREAAPDCFTIPGLEWGDYASADDYLRAAFQALKAGGDAVYCAASMPTVRRLRDEGIAVCGHSGLVPSQATWTGGFKAVGKTADQAMLVWRQIKALEEAGAFAAEIEAVPAEVAALVSRHTPLFMISMGAGAGCDAQYLFACDVLGTNRGFMPKHSKVYRNLAAEYDRLQAERVAAFREYHADVTKGAYPAHEHLQRISADELGAFTERLQTLLETDGRG